MPNSTPQPISFDAGPLTEPVDPKAVSAFLREMRARGNSSVNAGTVIAIVVVAVVLAVMLPMFGFIAAAGFSDGNMLFALPFVFFVLLAVGGGIAFFVAYRRNRTKRYRLSQFAIANGMSYQDAVKDPPLPGMIFTLGRARKAEQLVRGRSPRFVEFGNYEYTTGSGKHSTTHHWGYVAVKLDVPLPNIVLDALGNNGFGTNLPASFSKDQHLSLEGDFDRYFTLYCPEGYETDALYLFTPDIMARFIDNAAQLDVEIVDDWLFLYTKREASTLDADTWAWLFNVVGALITKFDQWARWRDDRLIQEQDRARSQAAPSAAQPLPAAGQPLPAGGHVMPAGQPPVATGAQSLPFAPPAGMLRPPPGVAREGRRLKRSTRWVPVIILALVVLGWNVSRLFN